MSSGLFREVRDVSAPRGTRFSALPVSVLVHVLLVIAIVVIPLLATDVLPLPNHPLDSWVPAVTAPPPPPPPSTARRIPTTMTANPDAAPAVAPSGFGRETALEPSEPSADAPGATAGVVPGGVDNGAGLKDTPPPPPPPVPEKPYRIVDTLRQPRKIVDVAPVYPELARQSRVEGVVIIEAIIAPEGNVREARVLRSHPLLDGAALTAVRQWRFTPTLLNGVPVPVVMTVTVNFTLR
jgi:protein TonB